LSSQRRRVVVPFPVERAQRREQPKSVSVLDLERELDERKRANIRHADGPGKGSASFTELINRARPRAFAVVLVGAAISVAALELCQGVR